MKIVARFRPHRLAHARQDGVNEVFRWLNEHDHYNAKTNPTPEGVADTPAIYAAPSATGAAATPTGVGRIPARVPGESLRKPPANGWNPFGIRERSQPRSLEHESPG